MTTTVGLGFLTTKSASAFFPTIDPTQITPEQMRLLLVGVLVIVIALLVIGHLILRGPRED